MIKLARLACWVGAITVLFGAWPGLAGEGGGSNYLQGTYGDWQSGIFGPPGLYYRDDLFRYNASIGARPLGGRVAGSSDETVWGNLSKVAYLTDYEDLGARIGTAIAVPVVINAHVSGEASGAGFSIFRAGNVSGLSDIFVTPVILNWVIGNHHLQLSPGFTAPTGSYSVNRLLNTGRNYWSVDTAGVYTWFDPQMGTDISLTAGVLANTTNPATHYHTGAEFHLDWLAGHFFSETFGAGATGYYYRQVQSDNGKVIGPIQANNFRGGGAAAGPAFIVNIPIFDTTVSVIGKALFDFANKDRFNGNLYMLSAAFKF